MTKDEGIYHSKEKILVRDIIWLKLSIKRNKERILLLIKETMEFLVEVIKSFDKILNEMAP